MKELPNKEPFKLFVNKNIPSRQKPLVEPRNFQRVQHLNVNQGTSASSTTQLVSNSTN